MGAFDEAEAWVPTMRLGPGKHRVKVESALATETARTKGPMVALELGNDVGNVKDWITLAVPQENVKGSSIGIQKIAALFDSAGVYRPKEGEYDPNTMAISQSALNRLAGRDVGILVAMEWGKDKDGVDKEYARVMGYLPASQVPVGGSTTASAPQPQRSTAPVMGAAPAADDDDIPF